MSNITQNIQSVAEYNYPELMRELHQFLQSQKPGQAAQQPVTIKEQRQLYRQQISHKFLKKYRF